MVKNQFLGFAEEGFVLFVIGHFGKFGIRHDSLELVQRGACCFTLSETGRDMANKASSVGSLPPYLLRIIAL